MSAPPLPEREGRPSGEGSPGSQGGPGLKGPPPDAGRGDNRFRKRVGIVLLVAAVIVGGGFGYRWFMHRLQYVSSDDARIQGEMVLISARRPGTVVELPVTEGQPVARGDLIARLDSRAAEADLELARADVERARAELERAKAELDLTREVLRLRRERAQNEVARTEAALRAAKAGLRQAEAALRAALVRFEDSVVTSPLDGVIARKIADRGETLVAGQPLVIVTDPAGVWVEANVEETELRRVELGSPVKVRVDARPGKTFTGTVSNIGAAANSQYSLLPFTNPSGQFIKVTQRVAVRIELEEKDPLLKPGMMVEVDIRAR